MSLICSFEIKTLILFLMFTNRFQSSLCFFGLIQCCFNGHDVVAVQYCVYVLLSTTFQSKMFERYGV